MCHAVNCSVSWRTGTTLVHFCSNISSIACLFDCKYKWKTQHFVFVGVNVLVNTVHDGHRAGHPGEPERAAPERWLHRGEQALGRPHRQQDVVRDAHGAGAAQASLPPAGRPQHLLRVQVRVAQRMWVRRLHSDLIVPVHSPVVFRFCHQLDFSTSGALCIALNKAAAARAYRCFKDRTVTKAYLALVCI